MIVIDEEKPGDSAPEARKEEGEEAGKPDIVAQSGHAPGLIAGTPQSRAIAGFRIGGVPAGARAGHCRRAAVP